MILGDVADSIEVGSRIGNPRRHRAEDDSDFDFHHSHAEKSKNPKRRVEFQKSFEFEFGVRSGYDDPSFRKRNGTGYPRSRT